MSKTIPATALLMALLAACGGGSDSDADRAIVDLLTDRLVQENAAHYAFGCVDFDGTVLSNDRSPDTIASDAGIEQEHAASAWVSDAKVFVLGGGDQQGIIIHDPASEATNAQEFEQREVATGGGTLTCFVPK